MSVCLSASNLRNYVSDVYQIFVHVTYVRSSVLLYRRCDMLCTSGFMDEVVFAHNGPYVGMHGTVCQPV